LEFGNEAWNSVYKGGNIESRSLTGNLAMNFWRRQEHAPVRSAKFNFVLNGQVDWVSRNVDIANAARTTTRLDYRVPLHRVDSYAKMKNCSARFLPSRRWSIKKRLHGQNLAVVQNSIRPSFVRYRSTWLLRGAIYARGIDSFTPSLSPAFAVANHMLMMSRDLG